MEFIHVLVNNQNYLLNGENIKEVLKYPTIKPLVDTPKYIEGIISHKDKIIPIITIRKLLGFASFKEQQVKLFKKVEKQHINWVSDFENTLQNNTTFHKTLDPHKCELGMWIDEMIRCMRCGHEGFTDIIKNEVMPHHNALHHDGAKILENLSPELRASQLEIIEKHKSNTIRGLSILEQEIDRLSSVVEQLVIYDIDGIDVGFIVDGVAQLHSLEEKTFNLGNEPLSKSNQFVQFIDHYEIKDELLFSMKFTRAVTELVEQWREKEIA
ncbi:MAG: chemotaxis protein CheW [Epsilonproteobacteria bacterium]|nr:chemotaxis protein CheW [Campylobacterota bacterium]